MANINLPQRYNDNSSPSSQKDLERLAIEMMVRGAFLFGGGLVAYIFIKGLAEE